MLKGLDHSMKVNERGRGEDKRGRRKKKRKKMTPDLGTFIQIHSHKFPSTLCSQLQIQDINATNLKSDIPV